MVAVPRPPATLRDLLQIRGVTIESARAALKQSQGDYEGAKALLRPQPAARPRPTPSPQEETPAPNLPLPSEVPAYALETFDEVIARAQREFDAWRLSRQAEREEKRQREQSELAAFRVSVTARCNRHIGQTPHESCRVAHAILERCSTE